MYVLGQKLGQEKIKIPLKKIHLFNLAMKKVNKLGKTEATCRQPFTHRYVSVLPFNFNGFPQLINRL